MNGRIKKSEDAKRPGLDFDDVTNKVHEITLVGQPMDTSPLRKELRKDRYDFSGLEDGAYVDIAIDAGGNRWVGKVLKN